MAATHLCCLVHWKTGSQKIEAADVENLDPTRSPYEAVGALAHELAFLSQRASLTRASYPSILSGGSYSLCDESSWKTSQVRQLIYKYWVCWPRQSIGFP